jgi:Uma2 family endonuclease
MVTREQLYTVEEFREYASLPENEHRRLELEDGEIIEMASSSPINTIVASRVGYFLNAHVIPTNSGHVTGADGGFKLGERNYRQPDCAFLKKERLAGKIPKNFNFAPDLAVEVVSPNEDVLKKVNEYLNAGTSIVWAIYCDEEKVYVFTLDAQKNLHGEPKGINDTLTGGDVLPNFSLPVRDIFPK